jgi:ABC-type multidrug transport system fused ATPase/permease subunit
MWQVGLRRNALFLGGYAAWALLGALLVIVRSRTILSYGLRTGSVMHDELLHALIRAPLRFFDTTPIGRLLARFSREMLVVDISLVSHPEPVITLDDSSSSLPCSRVARLAHALRVRALARTARRAPIRR